MKTISCMWICQIWGERLEDENNYTLFDYNPRYGKHYPLMNLTLRWDLRINSPASPEPQPPPVGNVRMPTSFKRNQPRPKTPSPPERDLLEVVAVGNPDPRNIGNLVNLQCKATSNFTAEGNLARVRIAYQIAGPKFQGLLTPPSVGGSANVPGGSINGTAPLGQATSVSLARSTSLSRDIDVTGPLYSPQINRNTQVDPDGFVVRVPKGYGIEQRYRLYRKVDIAMIVDVSTQNEYLDSQTEYLAKKGRQIRDELLNVSVDAN